MLSKGTPAKKEMKLVIEILWHNRKVLFAEKKEKEVVRVRVHAVRVHASFEACTRTACTFPLVHALVKTMRVYSSFPSFCVKRGGTLKC